jgi:hypothetical protein
MKKIELKKRPHLMQVIARFFKSRHPKDNAARE